MGLLKIFALAAVTLANLDNVMILKPLTGKTGNPAAWIVLPGAEIGKDTYKSLAESVQTQALMPLWVAVLGTSILPTPLGPEVGPRIDYVLGEMKAQGLDLDTVKIFYGGHSLGSVFIQDHLSKYHGSSGPMKGKIDVVGQVLMGGFIQRKYNWPKKTYPVSTLTIGGELDGLARPTRLAEAFHAADGDEKFPVVIIPGMSHMQFSSGEPPKLVKARDLLPDITYDEAHSAVGKIVADYFGKLVGQVPTGALPAALKLTEEFVQPIIDAYVLEGARYFNAPAQIGGPLASTCVKGGCDGKSDWAPKAQELISKVDGWKLAVSNEYVDVSATPLTGEEFHLPTITNDTTTKTIAITTYSQNYWDDATPSWFDWKEIFDHFDTGFVSTSAEEIATKLSSRQCTLLQGAGEKNVSFSVDDPQFCAQTNQQAYEWAQQHASAGALSRFKKYGQKYVFADDIAKSGGPFFIKSRLQFNEVTDKDGEKVISVAAPMQKTEVDYWEKHFHIPRPSAIPDPGCFHYCKLLSPARAMEWIYLDSLRSKRSLSSAQDSGESSLAMSESEALALAAEMAPTEAGQCSADDATKMTTQDSPGVPGFTCAGVICANENGMKLDGTSSCIATQTTISSGCANCMGQVMRCILKACAHCIPTLGNCQECGHDACDDLAKTCTGLSTLPPDATDCDCPGCCDHIHHPEYCVSESQMLLV